MTKTVKQFPFYVTYWDISEYCFWLVDTYGEQAPFVEIIDNHKFMEQCGNPQKYKKDADVLLREIRQCLVDNGFDAEIAACDKAFANNERKKRGIKPTYIPLTERWKHDKMS